MDWGMENCSISLNIPHQNTTETQVVIYGEASVEVSKLSIKEPLNRHTYSRNSMPLLREHIATVSLSYGSHYSLPLFDYLSGSHFTFEISCRKCHINVTHGGHTGPRGWWVSKFHSSIRITHILLVFYLLQSQGSE